MKKTKRNNIMIFILTLIGFMFFGTIYNMKNVSHETYAKEENPMQHYYPDLLYIQDIDYSNNTIYFKNSNDKEIIYVMDVEPDDMYIGEFYDAILYDNNTPEIMDDIVVKIHYERVDNFDYTEIYYYDLNKDFFDPEFDNF